QIIFMMPPAKEMGGKRYATSYAIVEQLLHFQSHTGLLMWWDIGLPGTLALLQIPGLSSVLLLGEGLKRQSAKHKRGWFEKSSVPSRSVPSPSIPPGSHLLRPVSPALPTKNVCCRQVN